ncbi:uncharacterized protein BDV14DRAFT_188272 [Aspergillus stella-maris]|uniref:uncharacterized protein n=1 Tax=Aspergillus stella-maris TaxID=1810926 RepID=UPI003CCE3BCD
MHSTSTINQSTHIVDLDGEVVIILRQANSLFSQPDEARGILSNVLRKNLDSQRYQSKNLPRASEEQTAEYPIEPELICEPLGEICFRIKVSAKHLIFASSVFKNMLTGGWEESIDYLQKGSVEITAESWDINMFTILLRIIHCKSSRIRRQLDLQSLAKIAVLADYCDCKEAIELAAVIWIKALKGSVSETYSRNLVLWLWVSWYSRLPSQFIEATSTAMSWCDNAISNLGLPIPESVISKDQEPFYL